MLARNVQCAAFYADRVSGSASRGPWPEPAKQAGITDSNGASAWRSVSHSSTVRVAEHGQQRVRRPCTGETALGTADSFARTRIAEPARSPARCRSTHW